MNKRTVLEVALPVVGVWCLIHALHFGLSYLALYAGYPDEGSLTPSPWFLMLIGVLFGVCLAVMGLLLLRFARGIAGRLAVGPTGTADEDTLDTQRRAFTLAMKVIGVWYALGVVPMVLQSLARSRILRYSHPDAEPRYNWWCLIAGLVVLTAACCFVSGAARLARSTFRRERGNPT